MVDDLTGQNEQLTAILTLSESRSSNVTAQLGALEAQIGQLTANLKSSEGRNEELGELALKLAASESQNGQLTEDLSAEKVRGDTCTTCTTVLIITANHTEEKLESSSGSTVVWLAVVVTLAVLAAVCLLVRMHMLRNEVGSLKLQSLRTSSTTVAMEVNPLHAVAGGGVRGAAVYATLLHVNENQSELTQAVADAGAKAEAIVVYELDETMLDGTQATYA
jgi:hypothetical protein